MLFSSFITEKVKIFSGLGAIAGIYVGHDEAMRYCNTPRTLDLDNEVCYELPRIALCCAMYPFNMVFGISLTAVAGAVVGVYHDQLSEDFDHS